jgi:hypothetical protein
MRHACYGATKGILNLNANTKINMEPVTFQSWGLSAWALIAGLLAVGYVITKQNTEKLLADRQARMVTEASEARVISVVARPDGQAPLKPGPEGPVVRPKMLQAYNSALKRAYGEYTEPVKHSGPSVNGTTGHYTAQDYLQGAFGAHRHYEAEVPDQVLSKGLERQLEAIEGVLRDQKKTVDQYLQAHGGHVPEALIVALKRRERARTDAEAAALATRPTEAYKGPHSSAVAPKLVYDPELAALATEALQPISITHEPSAVTVMRSVLQARRDAAKSRTRLPGLTLQQSQAVAHWASKPGPASHLAAQLRSL